MAGDNNEGGGKNEEKIIMQSKNKDVGFPFADSSPRARWDKYKETLGHLRGSSSRQVFPITESSGIFDEKNSGKQKERERICSTIDSRYGSLRNSGETYILKEITKNVSDAQRVYDSSGLAKTLKGEGGGQGAKTGLYMIDYRNKRPMDICPTLLGNDHNTIHRVNDGMKIRRLTPIECARLQSFPDNWCEGLSNTQAYKCYGNAVTVNVIDAIIKKINKNENRIL